MAGMTSEPQHARPGGFRRWPLFLIAAPAAVAVWSGWVGLGALAGFGVIHPLPGIVPGFRLNTAITLPVGVEAYGAYALGAWLAPFKVPPRARKFAQRSAIGALLLGMLGQVSYHLLAADHAARAPWLVVVAVSCMPVITLGFGVALTHLLRAGEGNGEATAQSHALALPESQASAMLEAIAEPEPEPVTGPPGEPVPEPVSATAAEPGAMPSAEPPEPRRRPSQDQDAKQACAAYRKSVRAGKPLTDRALGEMFGRSRTWGASRIKDCTEGPALAEAR